MGIEIRARVGVPTRFGEVQVASTGQRATDLLAITPIGSAWTEQALPAPIQDLFNVHIVEVAGTGRSEGGPESASVDAVVDTIHDVSDALTTSEPVLFGHSMNGTLVLAAAARLRCRGVIAVAPPPALPPSGSEERSYWEATADKPRRRRAAEIMAKAGETDDEGEKQRLWQDFDRLRRWYDPDFDTAALDTLAVPSPDWIAAVFASGEAIDGSALFQQVDVPVLLALGKYDFVVPMIGWTDANLPPTATVEVFERSGHTPYLEEPAEFVSALRRWLDRLA